MTPQQKAQLEELLAEAKRLRVSVTEKGPGHFHLQGACLVNYYPFAKTRTAFVAGRDSVKHVSPAEAVAMALEAPPEAPPPENYWTIFGRPVSEEEWRAFEMPDSTTTPPWKEEK